MAKKEKVCSAADLGPAIGAMFSLRGFLMMELLTHPGPRRWKTVLRGRGTERLAKDLAPVARFALSRYGLTGQDLTDDAVQRILLKLQEGSCFKGYRATSCTPRTFLMKCAPKYAMTIARSMWRERRRFRTNHEWREE